MSKYIIFIAYKLLHANVLIKTHNVYQFETKTACIEPKPDPGGPPHTKGGMLVGNFELNP